MVISIYAQWLENEFLPYLDKREKSMEDWQGFRDAADCKNLFKSSNDRYGPYTIDFPPLFILHIF